MDKIKAKAWLAREIEETTIDLITVAGPDVMTLIERNLARCRMPLHGDLLDAPLSSLVNLLMLLSNQRDEEYSNAGLDASHGGLIEVEYPPAKH